MSRLFLISCACLSLACATEAERVFTSTEGDKAVTAALTSAIGESTMERYGESGTRRRINRWDWNGYSFLLSNEEGEYVSLSIMSTETANNGGRSARRWTPRPRKSAKWTSPRRTPTSA